MATADDDDISHNDPTTDVSVEAAVVDKFELTAEKEADAEVPEEEEEDYDPFQTDHIEHMANGAVSHVCFYPRIPPRKRKNRYRLRLAEAAGGGGVGIRSERQLMGSEVN